MLSRIKAQLLRIFIITLCAVVANPTAAQWQSEIKGKFGELESGMVDIAAMIVGAALVIAAIIGAATGRIETSRMGAVIVAGIVVFFGPAALRTLLGA